MYFLQLTYLVQKLNIPLKCITLIFFPKANIETPRKSSAWFLIHFSLIHVTKLMRKQILLKM